MKILQNCLKRNDEWKKNSEQIDQNVEIDPEMISIKENADKSIT